MKWIDTRSATGRSGSRVHLLLAMVVALCAVFVACPALAQEEAARAEFMELVSGRAGAATG